MKWRSRRAWSWMYAVDAALVVAAVVAMLISIANDRYRGEGNLSGDGPVKIAVGVLVLLTIPTVIVATLSGLLSARRGRLRAIARGALILTLGVLAAFSSVVYTDTGCDGTCEKGGARVQLAGGAIAALVALAVTFLLSSMIADRRAGAALDDSKRSEAAT